jgi:hypothetical protein
VQTTLGHGNIGTTSGYLHARPDSSSGLKLDPRVVIDGGKVVHWARRLLRLWIPFTVFCCGAVGVLLYRDLFIFVGIGLVGWAVFVRVLNGRRFHRARGELVWHTMATLDAATLDAATLDATTRAPSPSKRTLISRQILHPVFVLFFFFVLYGFVSIFKDLANWLFK